MVVAAAPKGEAVAVVWAGVVLEPKPPKIPPPVAGWAAVVDVEPNPPNPVLPVEPKPVAGFAAVLPKMPPVVAVVEPKPPVVAVVLPRLEPKPVDPKGLAAERGDCVVVAVEPKMDVLVPVAAGCALKLKGEDVVAAAGWLVVLPKPPKAGLAAVVALLPKMPPVLGCVVLLEPKRPVEAGVVVAVWPRPPKMLG